MVPYPPVEPRLAEIMEAHREDIVDRLAVLEWAADPRDPRRLVTDPALVRPRAALFLEALISGLGRGDWTIFDAIAATTGEVLRSGQRSVQELNERALAIITILIPLASSAEDRDALLVATFRTMQCLSGGIVAEHHEHLVDQLQRLNELKSLFMRLTSHELRGPLTVTRGYASLLAGGDFGDLPAPAEHAANSIVTASETALSLIEGMSEVASLEGDAGVLRLSSVRLGEVIERAVADVLPDAEAKGVSIDRQVGEGVLEVDADRCVIAVRNLLGNAIKYGGRDVTVHVRAAVDRRHGARIEVEDEGPGISPADRERIFERYFRTDSSRTSAIPGSGLGLYIVRRIAELHGGEVRVSPTPAHGSRFTLSIPGTPQRATRARIG